MDCTVKKYVKQPTDTDPCERVDGLSIHWYQQFVKGQYPDFLASPDENHELTKEGFTEYIKNLIPKYMAAGETPIETFVIFVWYVNNTFGSFREVKLRAF